MEKEKVPPRIVREMILAVVGFRSKYPAWFTRKLTAIWTGEFWAIIAFPKDGSAPVGIGRVPDSYDVKLFMIADVDPNLYQDVVEIPEKPAKPE